MVENLNMTFSSRFRGNRRLSDINDRRHCVLDGCAMWSFHENKNLSVNNIDLGGDFAKADNRSGKHVQRNE